MCAGLSNSNLWLRATTSYYWCEPVCAEKATVVSEKLLLADTPPPVLSASLISCSFVCAVLLWVASQNIRAGDYTRACEALSWYLSQLFAPGRHLWCSSQPPNGPAVESRFSRRCFERNDVRRAISQGSRWQGKGNHNVLSLTRV